METDNVRRIEVLSALPHLKHGLPRLVAWHKSGAGGLQCTTWIGIGTRHRDITCKGSVDCCLCIAHAPHIKPCRTPHHTQEGLDRNTREPITSHTRPTCLLVEEVLKRVVPTLVVSCLLPTV